MLVRLWKWDSLVLVTRTGGFSNVCWFDNPGRTFWGSGFRVCLQNEPAPPKSQHSISLSLNGFRDCAVATRWCAVLYRIPCNSISCRCSWLQLYGFPRLYRRVSEFNHYVNRDNPKKREKFKNRLQFLFRLPSHIYQTVQRWRGVQPLQGPPSAPPGQSHGTTNSHSQHKQVSYRGSWNPVVESCVLVDLGLRISFPSFHSGLTHPSPESSLII